jgi:hypothetical protein
MTSVVHHRLLSVTELCRATLSLLYLELEWIYALKQAHERSETPFPMLLFTLVVSLLLEMPVGLFSCPEDYGDKSHPRRFQ